MRQFYSIAVLTATLILSGCRKYLEQPSPDEFVPSTTEDLRQILSYEGYPVANRPFHPYLSLLDDDVKSRNTGDGSKNWNRGRPAFTWSPTLYADMITGGESINTYALYYQSIKGCNVVLDMLSGVSGSNDEKVQLEGEALSLRALYYFMLVNLYGWPYNDTGHPPAQSLGVPLVLNGRISDAALPRNTVAQVYTQIERDITRGCALLERSTSRNTIYRINVYAAWLLASRIYLYQEKWDEVIRYADKVVAARPDLENMQAWVTAFGENAMLPAYVNPANREILFLYGAVDDFRYLGVTSNKSDIHYEASDDLTAIFGSNDLRRTVYVEAWLQHQRLTKVNEAVYYGKSFRVPEAYLNGAEARIRQSIRDGSTHLLSPAEEMLNNLLQSRYGPKKKMLKSTPDSPADAQQLLDFCLEERRRELCFEEQRWFDLRRYGMPAITHYYYPSDTLPMITYELAARSNRYVLPIPEASLVKNPALVPNP